MRPGLLYRGFRRVLRGLRKSFDARPHLAPTACPLAVAEMFDKTATCRKLDAAGVPVPDWLPTRRVPTGRPYVDQRSRPLADDLREAEHRLVGHGHRRRAYRPAIAAVTA